MAHSVVASNRNILVGQTSHPVTLASGVAAGDTIVVFFSDRTGGAVIDTVADDDSNSGYTLRSTYTNGTAITAVYVCENIAAASDGSLVITVTTTGSVSSQVVAVAIRSDSGGGVYPAFDQAATPLHTGSSVTSIESNTLTATAAGLLLGMLATGNTQGTTPTVGDHASLTGETVAPSGGAGVRSFAVYGANAAGGTLGFTAAASAAVTIASSNGQFHLINLIDSGGGGAPAPSITNVDTDDTITLEQANVVITGTDFDTATVEIRQDGFTYTPSIDSQNATTITFDMIAIGDTGPISAPHAGSAVLAVINGDDQEDTINITITDETGTETYLAGTPNADPDLRLTGSDDVEAGDYARISNVQGGTISDVTVNDDLTWNAEEGVTAFDDQFWDADDGTWGDRETQTVDDGTPDLVEVPDVVGDDEATATAALEGAGFVVSVSSDYSASVAVGNVISQSPPGGSMAEEGSTVSIVISLGAAEGAGGGLILMRRRGRR